MLWIAIVMDMPTVGYVFYLLCGMFFAFVAVLLIVSRIKLRGKEWIVLTGETLKFPANWGWGVVTEIHYGEIISVEKYKSFILIRLPALEQTTADLNNGEYESGGESEEREYKLYRSSMRSRREFDLLYDSLSSATEKKDSD